MEFTSTVLYQQHLVYYDVLTNDGQTFKARLLQHEGLPFAVPPKEVVLQKDGTHWIGNADEDILYYLSFDINTKLKEGNSLATAL